MIGADNQPMFGSGTPPWIGNGDNGSSSNGGFLGGPLYENGPIKRGGGTSEKKPFNYCSNKGAVKFVKDHTADAKKIANNIQVPFQFVLAVSANESSYGQYPTAAAANNYFGIHSGPIPKANGSTGPYSGNPILAAWAPGTNGFLGSGNAFATMVWRAGAAGSNNPEAFFGTIHKGYFGVNTPDYVSDMLSILDAINARLKCP